MEKENKFKGMNIVVFIIFLVALLIVGIISYSIATKQNNISGKLENNSSSQEKIKNTDNKLIVDNSSKTQETKNIEETDNSSAKVKYVKEEIIWNTGKNEDIYYIKICGFDENEKEVWNYNTQEDKNDSQYGRIEYIGTYDNEIVLLGEFGILKALEYNTGRELWTNNEYKGLSSKQITDMKGNIYLYSYDQGKIFEIDKLGKTIKNIKIDNDLAPNEAEPEISIIYNNGNAEKIQMQWTEPAGLWDDDYHREFVLTIDLQTNKMDRTVKKIPISNNDEVSKLRKDELKIAGIGLGMTKNDVIRLYGNGYTETEKVVEDYDGNEHSDMIYNDLGLTIDLKYEDNKAVVDGVGLTGSKTEAIRKLKVSSTKEEVLKAFRKENIGAYYYSYTNADEIGDGIGFYEGNDKSVIQCIEIGLEGFILYEWDTNGKILFTLKDNKVTSISLYYGAE